MDFGIRGLRFKRNATSANSEGNLYRYNREHLWGKESDHLDPKKKISLVLTVIFYNRDCYNGFYFLILSDGYNLS